MSDEKFGSRWSRLKTESRKAETGSPAQSAPAAVPRPPGSAAPLPGNEAPLPSLDELKGLVSEYREFLKPGVDENLRRAALKKLFLDPHFNVMDGLDVYIDDYSKADPIPEEMLKRLAHARDLLFKEDETASEKPSNAQASPAGAESPAAPGSEDKATPESGDARPAGGKLRDERSG